MFILSIPLRVESIGFVFEGLLLGEVEGGVLCAALESPLAACDGSPSFLDVPIFWSCEVDNRRNH